MIESNSLYDILVWYCNERWGGIHQLAKGSDALLFLATELGELTDAHLRTQKGWCRNNECKVISLEDEVGDVLMMLTAYAHSQGLPDPVQCMKKKMTKTLGG